ncbi:unnamed protein product [Aphanomyces euteiches]
MAKERQVIPSSSDHGADRYKSFLESTAKDETQPEHKERAFKRMMSQPKLVEMTSKWTNQYDSQATEAAFQSWSCAFYVVSAKMLMSCVIFFHVLLAAIDYSFSPSTGAYLAKYGYTELAQWMYLVVLCPLLVVRSSWTIYKRCLWYFHHWKWVVVLSMVFVCTGLMIRTGCVYDVNLHKWQTNLDTTLKSLNVSITLEAKNAIAATFNDAIVAIAGNLVVAGDTILILITQACEQSHLFQLTRRHGIQCYLITRELDLSHRINFLNYYQAETSAQVLRDQLDQALELIVYNDCKAEEKAAVTTAIDDDAQLCAKLEPYRIPFENLKLERVIGQGAYGQVILAQFCGTAVVLKRMHRHKITNAAMKQFTDEILLMSDLRHPNIVQFIGASWDTYANIGFVLEYVGQGDLYMVIHDKRIPKSWVDPFHRIAVDAARGMCYLHSKNIVHRDLKSSNILVSPTYAAKICDLGMSKSIDELKQLDQQVGTPLWTAPEVVTGGRCSFRSDVYAFGIILTELITRKTPYEDQTPGMSAYKIMLEVATNGLRPTLPSWLPDQLRRLVDTCLDANPSNRPTMLEVLDTLQIDAIVQLQGHELWKRARQLVHEKAHRSTQFSVELVRLAKAQSELEACSRPRALDTDLTFDSVQAMTSVLDTTIVEEW